MNEEQKEVMWTAHHDAMAWIEAALEGDHEGRIAIAHNTDPLMLVDVITMMHIQLIRITTNDQPHKYLAFMRKTVGEYLTKMEDQ